MGPLHLRELLRSSLLCLTVSVVTAGLLRIFYDRLAFFHFQRFPDLVPLAVAGAVFVTVSLAALYALKCKEVPELLGILSRRRR
jgi:hypothetical protein